MLKNPGGHDAAPINSSTGGVAAQPLLPPPSQATYQVPPEAGEAGVLDLAPELEEYEGEDGYDGGRLETVPSSWLLNKMVVQS